MHENHTYFNAQLRQKELCEVSKINAPVFDNRCFLDMVNWVMAKFREIDLELPMTRAMKSALKDWVPKTDFETTTDEYHVNKLKVEKEANKRFCEIEWERIRKILDKMGYSPLPTLVPDWMIAKYSYELLHDGAVDKISLIREATQDVKPPLEFLTILGLCDTIWPPKQYYPGRMGVPETRMELINPTPNPSYNKTRCGHCRSITNTDDGCCTHCGAPIDLWEILDTKSKVSFNKLPPPSDSTPVIRCKG